MRGDPYYDRFYDRLDSLPPAYAQRLRQLRVLDDIDIYSASWVTDAIINAVTDRGLRDRTTPVALRQKAANVACRSSLGIWWWHDPAAVSNALAAAADELDRQRGKQTPTQEVPMPPQQRAKAVP
jgi:hypothetical protein